MIKCYCDLCEGNVDKTQIYYLPMMNKNGEFHPVRLHLCDTCCNKIETFARELVSSEMKERLDNIAYNCTNSFDW